MSETGRFINADNVDILEEAQYSINGLNLYAYCSNNPIMFVDPSGQFWDIFKKAADAIGNFVDSTVGQIVVTIAIIAVLGIATVLTGGAAGVIFGAAFWGAVTGAVSGAAIGAGMGIVTGLTTGDWSGMLGSMTEGMMFGALGGAAFGAAGSALKTGGVALTNFRYAKAAKFIKTNGGDVERVMSAFEGVPRVIKLRASYTVGRTWGGSSLKKGDWYSPVNYGSATRSKLALPPENTMANLSIIRLPKGTVVLHGRAAKLYNQPGGGIQWWLKL